MDKNIVEEFQCLEKHKLDTITQQYLRAFQNDVNPETEFTIALVNTRSLTRHVKDIERDPVLTKADVLCLTETCNAPSIKGYDVIVCTEEAERPAGGVRIYVKRPLNAIDLDLQPISQSHNGEHSAITLYTYNIIMTMYLAPNLSQANVEKYIEKAMLQMLQYETTYKNTPFILAGDFNVNITNDDWFKQHMGSCYALRCISYDYKQPTTIRGTCIDLIFSNFRVHPLQQPLTLHFTDHKAVIVKAKRQPQLDVTYVEDDDYNA